MNEKKAIHTIIWICSEITLSTNKNDGYARAVVRNKRSELLLKPLQLVRAVYAKAKEENVSARVAQRAKPFWREMREIIK